MTIEEKAKAYDKALKKAKDCLKDGTITSTAIDYINTIFPELKNKDEEIREWLIDWAKAVNWSEQFTITKEQVLAWLEKQGNQKPVISDDALREGITHFGITQYQIDNWLKKYVNVEKQGEQKPSNVDYYHVDDEVGNPNDWVITTSHDKVKPKFKVGDWVVWNDKYYKVNYNGCGYELIDQDGLHTSLEYGTVDENAHIFDIADAKAGDVLEFGDHGRLVVGIVSYVNKTTGKVDVNCLLENNNFKLGNYYNLDTIKPHPATKEQCDTLEKAMAYAGWEFDFEKKELKKIEETINGEDYGIDGLWHAQRILEKTLGSVDGYQSDDGILEHKAAITAVKKLYDKK